MITKKMKAINERVSSIFFLKKKSEMFSLYLALLFKLFLQLIHVTREREL